MTASSQIRVFDRALLRRRRDRAALRAGDHGALADEVEAQLLERLSGVTDDFRAVLELGTHSGGIAKHFRARGAFAVAADISKKMLGAFSLPAVACDEEFLPFAPGSFDLVVSNLSLQWVNDLPGALLQVREALRPGGLFLAAVAGGASLFELRTALMEAELKVSGGASLRLSPMIESATASALLQRAGFALPVTDQEQVTLSYSDLFALMNELRGMGAANAALERPRRFARRGLFLEAARLYKERFASGGQRLPASFEILFLHGRKAG